ncbi:pentapeptide repeat-containing protein [uncultured Roseobacter sp.]|uniref:pentapeptide repeat-containing protein n=1 Tax=uncultured Roseobacter sp. TaxID=114847 RepID=UPI0026026559|nr:pentapeptide repeat-containing protein [uncultured Roseobacter sp.]
MKETLFSSTSIVLFGRHVDDLSVGSGSDTAAKKPDGQFARIYGFTYDGIYFEIPAPVLMMVKGAGVKCDTVPVPGPNPRDKKFYAELKAWIVKRDDETVRLDVEQGKFEDVLLSVGMDGVVGVSGARVSGARVSGARVSGARISGARVSGARISGARGDASD